ncbi:hypothetical protein EVAR_78428_1 [Eumeta japonica]|uniref:Uncharacterized protein n=1 Tax=Eumeta variegata TaxID=151549 RepID=A0A4C1TY83_EUMVA|nr:hypothetical protein EVAR_78428_1 [Eumeta japonica]
MIYSNADRLLTTAIIIQRESGSRPESESKARPGSGSRASEIGIVVDSVVGRCKGEGIHSTSTGVGPQEKWQQQYIIGENFKFLAITVQEINPCNRRTDDSGVSVIGYR